MTTKSTHIEQLFHEGSVFVCAHRVPFFYRIPGVLYNDIKQRLTQEAESRAKSQIIKGYVQGVNSITNPMIGTPQGGGG